MFLKIEDPSFGNVSINSKSSEQNTNETIQKVYEKVLETYNEETQKYNDENREKILKCVVLFPFMYVLPLIVLGFVLPITPQLLLLHTLIMVITFVIGLVGLRTENYAEQKEIFNKMKEEIKSASNNASEKWEEELNTNKPAWWEIWTTPLENLKNLADEMNPPLFLSPLKGE